MSHTLDLDGKLHTPLTCGWKLMKFETHIYGFARLQSDKEKHRNATTKLGLSDDLSAASN